jgi:hypothetical protein
MRVSAGYVLLASGTICLLMAWYSQLPTSLYSLKGLAGFIGFLSLITAWALFVTGRTKPR